VPGLEKSRDGEYDSVSSRHSTRFLLLPLLGGPAGHRGTHFVPLTFCESSVSIWWLALPRRTRLGLVSRRGVPAVSGLYFRPSSRRGDCACSSE
jgi:hypothetical protein